MATILDKIVETKQHEVDAAKQQNPLAAVQNAAESIDKPRDFLGTLSASPPHGIHLIAEVKKASPSAGLIVEKFDPATIARTYVAHQATAISVLTDSTYFQGRLADIDLVKQAVSVPVLRKEFIIDRYQVYESRAAGADAILLIAEVLPPHQIASYWCAARELGMGVVVEVHSDDNLRAVVQELGTPCQESYALGINNRDLARQLTDLETTTRLAPLLPKDALLISESGIATRKDVETIQNVGINAMLVGESLLRADDTGGLIDDLLGVKRQK